MAIDRCDAQAGAAIRLIISALGQTPGAVPLMDAPNAEAPLTAGEKAYLEFLSGENARLEEELSSTKQQLIEADNKNQINDEVITVANGEKAKAEKERDEAKAALETSQARVKELEADLEKKKEEVEDGKADIEDLREKVEEQSQAIKAKNKELDEKVAEIEKAQSDVTTISGRISELEKSSKEAAEEHARIVAEKDTKIEALEKAAIEKEFEIAGKETEIKELNETLAKVSAEAKGSRSDDEIKVLEESLLNKDRRILALTAALERCRHDNTLDINPGDARTEEAATDIADILDPIDEEDAIAALRRVGIGDTRDIRSWSREDLHRIPMVDDDVIEHLEAFGVTFAEGSDEGHLAAIRIPRDKIVECNIEDVLNDDVLQTPILSWRPKCSIDDLLLVRLSEYGIQTIGELVTIDRYYLQTLPGIDNGQCEAILRALRSEGDLNFKMTEQDLKLWAGHRRVEKEKKSHKRGKRVGTLPFNNADAAVLNKDAVRCGIVHFGPLGNGRRTFIENTGIETLGDLASLHRDDVELLYFFYGGDKLEKALTVLENNGLHLGMNDEHRKEIVETKEVYMRGADALQLPIAVVLPTRKNICERLAGKGCHVLGDLKEITFEEAITIGVDKDIIAYLRDNCKARGINGVIEHAQEK